MCPISMPWKHAFSKRQVERVRSHSPSGRHFKEGKLSSSPSLNSMEHLKLNSMEQLKLLEIENNNCDFEGDRKLWMKSGRVEEKTAPHKSSLADLFKYTPV